MHVGLFLDATERRVLYSLWTCSNFVYDWTQIKDSLHEDLCALLNASQTQLAVYLSPARANVRRLLKNLAVK
jgi:hypothetical protein